LIKKFTDWFNELGANAIKMKKDIALKTGKKPKWTRKAKPYQIKQVLLAIEKVEVNHGF